MPDLITLTIAEKLLGFVKTLFGFKESLAKAKLERRQRMAVLFESVAACLEDTARQIRGGSYPAGRCHELLTYAVELPATVEDEVGAAKAQEIGAALTDAHEIERLFGDRNNADGPAQIAKLDEAAGLLRALSNLVKV